MARLLVVGGIRSGKTTFAAELERLERVGVVEEPDNPLGRPFGLRVGRRLGQRYFPAFGQGAAAFDDEQLGWLRSARARGA